VQADLVGWGVPAGPELVRSLMRELGLEPNGLALESDVIM
jgi:putative transposase